MPIIDLAAVVPVVPIESREAGARCAAPPCRSSTAGKVVPIIQGHGLASWCRAGSPSCRCVDRRRPVSGKVAMGSGFIFPSSGGEEKAVFQSAPAPKNPPKNCLHCPCHLLIPIWFPTAFSPLSVLTRLFAYLSKVKDTMP